MTKRTGSDTSELPGLDESGAAPKERVKGVGDARAIYSALKSSDDIAASDRANVQKMFDGDPPYDPNVLRELGQGYRCNLNFGEAAATLEAALTGYNDLTNSVDVMAMCPVTKGDPSEKMEWGRTISEEFHRLNVDLWPGFEFQKQLLAHYFVTQGVAVSHFPNAFDWRWRASSLAEFKFPRTCQADENTIEVAACEYEYLPHELYEFIRDPKSAKGLGWNVPAVKHAILSAASRKLEASEWEKMQEEIKGNDLASSYASASPKVVNVVHMWVREFDGKVSFYIFTRDGLPVPQATESAKGEWVRDPAGYDSFLYKQSGKFEKIQDAFVLFTYGIGNGRLHSIRGLGHKIFPHVQVTNRLRCQVVDSTFMSAALMVQPATANDVEDMSLIYNGPLAILPHGVRAVDVAHQSRPDTMLPVVNDLGMLLQNNVGGYKTRAVTPEGQPRTATEIRAQLQQEATLSVAAMNLFYLPWKRLLNAQYRRLINNTWVKEMPGGAEAMEFLKRCRDRGVPPEAMKSVTAVEPVRAVGYGSPSMRLMALDELMGMLPMLDEIGRNNAIRDRISARFGSAHVDRYVTKISETNRQPVDAKLAELENNQMAAGQEVSVQMGEHHATHLQVHLVPLAQAAEMAVGGGEVPPTALQSLTLLARHAIQHLAVIAGDKTYGELVAQANKILQNVQEIIVNLGRQVEKMQREAAEAQPQQMAAAQPQQPDILTQAKVAKLQTETQIAAAKAEAELQMKMAESQRKAVSDDLKAAKLVG